MSQNTRGARRSTKRRNSLTDLPDNVLMDIFSRLPWRTLLACQCVCRIFNDLASSIAHFNGMNASPAVVMMRYPSRNLHLFDPEVNPHIRRRRTLKYFTKFPFPIPKFCHPTLIDLVESCKGLLYLESRCAREPDSIIFNPLTNEYVSVPRDGSKYYWVRVLGFSALDNQYKVLSISRTKLNQPFDCEIYEVGSGLWRDVERCPYFGPYVSFGHATYLNGAAYMFLSTRVVYFDFDKEKFGEIAVPMELISSTWDSYRTKIDIGVLGGCLCMYVNYCEYGKRSLISKRFDLWVMREETWNKEFVIDDPLISDFRLAANLRPFQVLSTGEILMLLEGS